MKFRGVPLTALICAPGSLGQIVAAKFGSNSVKLFLGSVKNVETPVEIRPGPRQTIGEHYGRLDQPPLLWTLALYSFTHAKYPSVLKHQWRQIHEGQNRKKRAKTADIGQRGKTQVISM